MNPRGSVAVAPRARARAPLSVAARAALRPPATVSPAATATAGADTGKLLDGLARDVGVIGQPQADATALAVHLHDAHVDLIALVQDILDGLHALTGRDVRDVQQPVGALGQLDECAEGGGLHDLADILVADLDLLHHHANPLDERVSELAVGGVDQHLAVV